MALKLKPVTTGGFGAPPFIVLEEPPNEKGEAAAVDPGSVAFFPKNPPTGGVGIVKVCAGFGGSTGAGAGVEATALEPLDLLSISLRY